MSGNRTQYSDAILLSLPPVEAAAAIKDRLNRAKLANDEIADWIKERLLIEERYASELHKLGAKPMQYATEDSLGAFSGVWRSVVHGAEQSAKISLENAKRGHAEIEPPIRNFSEKSRQWTEVRTLYESLSTLAKSLSDAEEQHSKNRAKHLSDAKTEQAQIRLAETQSQWESQAPFVFSQFEAADNGRFVLLKETLSILLTLEADKAKANSGRCESILDTLLNFDPQKELSEYAERAAKGEIQPLKTGHHHTFSGGSATGSIAAAVHKPKRMASGMSMNKSQPSHNSGASASGSSSGGIGFRNPLHRSSTSGSGQPSSGAKIRSRVGSIFRKSKNKDRNEQTIDLSPTPSSESSVSGSSSRDGLPPRGRRGPGINGRTGTMPAMGSNSSQSSGSGLHGRPLAHASTAPFPSTNGNQRPQGKLVDQARNSDPAFDVTDGSGMSPNAPGLAVDRTSKPRPPPSRKMHPGDEPYRERILTVDEEVEDNLPLRMSIRKEPVAERHEDANEALTNVASTLRATPTVSSRRSRGRRDIQSKLFTEMDDTGYEDAANGALPQRFQSQLQTLDTTPGAQNRMSQVINSPNAGAKSMVSPTSPLGPSSTGNSFFNGPPNIAMESHASQAMGMQNTGAQSITSASSAGTPQAVTRHSELPHDMGVVSSIIETHCVTLKDGRVQSNKLSGEAVVGCRGVSGPVQVQILPSDSASQNDITVNPSLLQPMSNNIYALDTINCRETGTLAFNYNLIMPANYTPVLFSPIWRIEENQSSLMLTYHLTEECLLPQVVLNDLTIIVPVEQGMALSAQSKPPASFNKEKQRVVWRLHEPLVVKRGEEGRFLCRLITNGRATEGAAGIDIRFNSLGRVLPDAVNVTYSANNTGEWMPVSSANSVVGRYVAHSEQNVQSK